MRAVLHCLIAIGASLLLASCSTGPQYEVARRWGELKAEGKLPGFTASDHGNIQTEARPLGYRFSYPATEMIYGTKPNDTAHYTYTFTKDSASSEWRLTAAWRTSEDGQREDLEISN
jgi:hypothetical protein